jgi:hypothetical protein
MPVLAARSTVTWRYLTGRQVKHALTVARNHLGHRLFSLCGAGPTWHDPHGWQPPTEGMPECRRCSRLLAPAERTEPA